jgi:hypothetical protein
MRRFEEECHLLGGSICSNESDLKVPPAMPNDRAVSHLVDRYPIVSIEYGLAENGWAGFRD